MIARLAGVGVLRQTGDGSLEGILPDANLTRVASALLDDVRRPGAPEGKGTRTRSQIFTTL